MASRATAKPRTLGIRSVDDLLAKLDREIERLKRANDTTDAIDHATNAAMTAWHVTDWAWQSIDANRDTESFRLLSKIAGKAIRDFPQFKQFVLDRSDDIGLCEDVAVSTKHVGSSGQFETEIERRTENTTSAREATGITFTFSEHGTEIGHTRTFSEIIIVEESKRTPIIDILTNARNFWSELFLKLQIS